ncbi:MAG: two-component system, OmpR family, response regulator [Pseudonocardiales bacterium]|jgi:two-component system OmpR family response regulator|nr:two-component system, OmpR family, response regulator [Pseudonocardiales bacterium]MDT4941126.1 two-component system, OmpR family, response regulator [Pseudonocardiales bacterium]
MRVLVVEDELAMAGVLNRGLTEEGFAVDVAGDGVDGLWYATEYDYDAIVLDVGLPGRDGFGVLVELRRAGSWVPVLLLTARDAVEDRVRGLDLGADDYLTKPFAFPELLARLRVLLRRGARPRPAVLVVGELRLDPAERTATRGDLLLELTAKEFAVLECFMRRPGEVLTRTQLIEHVWDAEFDNDSNIVDVYLASLRSKVDRPFGTHLLETVRGVGYRLAKTGPDDGADA